MNKKIISILSAAAITFGAAASAANKYNELDYISISGYTLDDIAALSDFDDTDKFKKSVGLPADMPGDTNETAAYFSLSLKSLAEYNDQSLKELLNNLSTAIGEKVKDTDKFGDVVKKLPTKAYIELFFGEDFDEFKESFELGEDFDENTPYGEISTKIDRMILEGTHTLQYFDRDAILIMLKGKYLNLDVAPIIENNRTMVPLRGIFEALGANVQWESETKTIIAAKDDTSIILQIGQDQMFVNGEAVEIDSPSIIVQDRTLVPLRAVATALGNEVGYNENTKTVIIH